MNTSNVSQKFNDVVIVSLVMKWICVLKDFKSHKVIWFFSQRLIIIDFCDIIERIFTLASDCTKYALINANRVISYWCTHWLKFLGVKHKISFLRYMLIHRHHTKFAGIKINFILPSINFKLMITQPVFDYLRSNARRICTILAALNIYNNTLFDQTFLITL